MSRRFYKIAASAQEPSSSDNERWRVELDGKPVKTPTGKPLAVASRALADRIAQEWDAQGADIRPETMPITRLAGVALERADTRDDLVGEICAYAATDLLSYRADAPEDLVSRQADAFDPLLEWMGVHGLQLRTTMGILAVEQDPLTLDRLAEHARGYDDLALTLFTHLTATFGSGALALAVMQGRLEAGEAYDLSRLDERYRTSIWGEDEEAEDRAAAIRAETVAMSAILDDLTIPALDIGKAL